MRSKTLTILFIAFVLIGLSLWWVVSAGPVTVYRIIYYNFSGIDDYIIFPQRQMKAASQSFNFNENIDTTINPKFSFGNRHDVPLDELLKTTDTTAFIVIKNDTVVIEKYFDGYDKNKPSLSFSMAKSFFSVLIGCAIDDGYISSVGQPITDFVPELKDKGFDKVKLKHLLQMTSGVDYAENDFPFGIHTRFYYTDHLEKEILKLKLREEPGTRFLYKSGDTLLLALALKRALKEKTITEYMQERLWIPMGMEYDGIWSIDHTPDGLEKTSSSLTATARDFAKFGRLYLNNGVWNGKRIVSENWINESTQTNTNNGSAWNYQNMWWLAGRDRPDFMANGHLGQFLYVNPKTKVIIVRLGNSTGGLKRREWEQVLMELSDKI